MVIESIVNPLSAEHKPFRMVMYGILYSTVAIVLSLWIFRDSASLVMVFLTTLACVPLVYNTMKLEEQKDETISKERVLLREHIKALSFLMWLFAGVVISCAIWYVILPSGSVTNLFSIQTRTIAAINSNVVGHAFHMDQFFRIFFNNLKVLIFCILFAFVYGVGAIFILVWNASVIGTAIGNFIRTELSKVAASSGLSNAASYFQIFSVGFLKYALHGIPEILAYFTAGLAAGIISIAMIRHRLDPEKFKRVALDSVDLILLSVAMLFVAALLEVYVTPVLF